MVKISYCHRLLGAVCPVHFSELVVLIITIMFGASGVDGFAQPASFRGMANSKRSSVPPLSMSMRVGMPSSRAMDPYLVLGLKPGTQDRRAIKSRFRSLVRQLHPDTSSEGSSNENR